MLNDIFPMASVSIGKNDHHDALFARKCENRRKTRRCQSCSAWTRSKRPCPLLSSRTLWARGHFWTQNRFWARNHLFGKSTFRCEGIFVRRIAFGCEGIFGRRIAFGRKGSFGRRVAFGCKAALDAGHLQMQSCLQMKVPPSGASAPSDAKQFWAPILFHCRRHHPFASVILAAIIIVPL